ncbi:MAG: acyl transferase [Vicingaceae bacterium]
MHQNFQTWSEEFEQSIFKVDEHNFEVEAIKLFHFQYHTNPVYQEYVDLIGRPWTSVQSLEDIPFLPIQFFKTHPIKCGSFEPQAIFESSGTTQSVPSKHMIKKLSLYQKSFHLAFEKHYGAIQDYCILALLPAYLERTNSSLVYMANQMIEESKDIDSGFFLHELEKLKEVLQEKKKEGKKTLLLGVSFALLDLAEMHDIPTWDKLIVMETGGMKGRRKEMVREELHELLKAAFKQEQIHSEYGMTELLSQAYAQENGLFTAPSWMKVLVRQQEDPFRYCRAGETGALNIIDFANLHTCAFIQTDDLGREKEDGKFEVLGRFDQADVRGCNLLVG